MSCINNIGGSCDLYDKDDPDERLYCNFYGRCVVNEAILPEDQCEFYVVEDEK